MKENRTEDRTEEKKRRGSKKTGNAGSKAISKSIPQSVPIEELESVFRNAGLKMTNQRIAVYRKVRERADCRDHITAEQVYESIRESLPAVSLNTVYRALSLLAGKGLVKRLTGFGACDVYDARLTEHWHFVCTRCGAIEDVPAEKEIFPPVTEGAGRVDEVLVQFRGLCAACLPRQQKTV
jgi:Fe2+ or Zn2+ uptake regulation protein